MSELKERRPLDDDKPEGYLESDQDYLLNNRDLAVNLLDNFEENLAELKVLDALRAGGVDSWDGYEFSLEDAEL